MTRLPYSCRITHLQARCTALPSYDLLHSFSPLQPGFSLQSWQPGAWHCVHPLHVCHADKLSYAVVWPASSAAPAPLHSS